MKRTLTLLTLLAAVVAAPCAAQQNGWSALGEMLGGRKERDRQVYDDAYREAVEMEAIRRQAQAMGEEAALARAVANSQQRLAGWWESYGLPQAEAAAVAQTFVADSRQHALNARAQRDGYEPTIEAAVAAYGRYDYLLANQLLIAASLLPAAQGR